MNTKGFKLTVLRFTIVTLTLFISLNLEAQSARTILDKTAAVVGRKGGASANFTISGSQLGSTSGKIAIKANKFYARTPQAIVWYDGKTQWSYLKKTNEVNISHPSQSQQMSMNPYTFINMYKNGYSLTFKSLATSYQIHMIAQNAKTKLPEMYILINKNNYRPSQVKMRQGKTWTTINITAFKPVNQPDNIFVFQSKDAPSAEVIDLR